MNPTNAYDLIVIGAGNACTVESRKTGQETSILDIRNDLTVASKKALTGAA